MIVTLDGHRLTDEFASDQTLADVIESVRQTHLRGRLVVSVAVNGQALTENELDTGLKRELQAGDQLDLESGEPRLISCAALRDVARQLSAASEQSLDLAERLGGGEAAGAIREIGDALQVWNVCRSTVIQCSGLLERDVTQMQVKGRSIGGCLNELVEKLRELRDALEAHDMVLLTDLMHYEMPELCTQWRDLLSALADGIENPIMETRQLAAAPK